MTANFARQRARGEARRKAREKASSRSESIPSASELALSMEDEAGLGDGTQPSLLDRAGVSPWNWWADVPIAPVDALYVAPGRRVEKPEVKFCCPAGNSTIR